MYVCKRCGNRFDEGLEEHFYCDDCLEEMKSEEEEGGY